MKSKRASDQLKAQIFCSDAHFVEISGKLQEFFDNQQFCDITLISADGAHKIKAHKNVLAAVSKYFLAMFGGYLCESKETEVILSQLNGDALKDILNFIYKGIIELTVQSVESVLEGAHILELSALEKICCAYMIKHLDVSNCLGVLNFAKQHSFDEMYNAAMSCACVNFVALRTQNEFHLLQLEQLCELISNEYIRKNSEGEVFHAIMAWINHKRDERKVFLEKLFSYIRFQMLPPSFIAKFVEKECESLETSRIVCKALAWHALQGNSPKEFTQEPPQELSSKIVIGAISGFGNSNFDLNVALKYPSSGEWIYAKWPHLPFPRTNVKYTTWDKKLIIAGGRENGKLSNRVDSFNMETLEWTQFPAAPLPIINCLVIINEAVYVFDRRNMYRFEELSMNWTQVITDAECLRDATACAAHNGVVYFPYNHFIATYNTLENKFNLQKVKRRSNSYVVGMHIVQHLESEYLVEVTKNHVYAYNLHSTDLAVENSSPLPRISSTSVFGSNIIMNRGTTLCVYNVFEKTLLDDLPPIKRFKEIDAVVTYCL